jgi:hypothetical protein
VVGFVSSSDEAESLFPVAGFRGIMISSSSHIGSDLAWRGEEDFLLLSIHLSAYRHG